MFSFMGGGGASGEVLHDCSNIEKYNFDIYGTILYIHMHVCSLHVQALTLLKALH